MGAKKVQILYANGNNTWNTIPSPSAELSVEGEEIEDTILGASWQSDWVGLINWSVSATAYFKGKAGYQAKIKKDGTEMPAKSFELTQNADAIDISDLPRVQSNNGYLIQTPGLRTIELSVSGFYNRLGDFFNQLENRSLVTISIQPAGSTTNEATGDFVLPSFNWSGDVGPPENEELNFRLNVPYTPDSSGGNPFKWTTGGDMPAPIVDLINSFTNRETVEMRYMPEGVPDSSSGSVKRGDCFVTDLSLSCGTEGNVEFSVELASAGQLT